MKAIQLVLAAATLSMISGATRALAPPRLPPATPAEQPLKLELPKRGPLVVPPPDLYFLPRAAQELAAPAVVLPTAVPRQLTLKLAEAILLAHNPAILNARQLVEAAIQNRTVASKRPNPQLTIGGEQLNAGTYMSPPASQTFTVRLDQPYERGGKRRYRTWQAAAQAYNAEATLSDTIRTQLAALRNAFASGILARENLNLAVEVLAQYLKTEQLTDIKVKAGELSGLDLYRAQSARLQYQQAVLQAETQYANATRDVLNALGETVHDIEPPPAPEVPLPPDALSDPASMITSAPITAYAGKVGGASLDLVGEFDERHVTLPLEDLRRIALTSRPDVLAARYNVDAARHALLGARALRTRDVSVGTEYQYLANYTDFGTGAAVRTKDNTVGVVFSTSLFTNNDHRAEIAQAEAQLKSAVALARQAELNAIRDVESAYQAYKLARRTRDLYSKENLGLLKKMVDIASFSFKNGATTLFELLDSQRTYRQAIAAYNQSRSDYTSALINLESAIGSPLTPSR